MAKKPKHVVEEISEIDKCILVLQMLVKKALMDSEQEAAIAAHFRPQYLKKLADPAEDEHDGNLLFHYVTPHEHYSEEYQYNADYFTKTIDLLNQLKQTKEV
jgi:hypothetical protein